MPLRAIDAMVLDLLRGRALTLPEIAVGIPIKSYLRTRQSLKRLETRGLVQSDDYYQRGRVYTLKED
jgi:hypothetical protein